MVHVCTAWHRSTVKPAPALLNLTKSSSSKQAQKAVRIESGKDVGAGSCAGQLVHALIPRKLRGRFFIETKDSSIAATGSVFELSLIHI